jgi:hypothetical protein
MQTAVLPAAPKEAFVRRDILGVPEFSAAVPCELMP